jgi:hypothetical protein
LIHKRLQLKLNQTSAHQKHAYKTKNPATSRVLGLIEAQLLIAYIS